MASWAADMQKYKREKQQTAWDHLGVGQKPVEHVRWSEVSQQQRAFNPVTQQYIVTAREKSSAQRDQKAVQVNLARAKIKQENYAFGAYDPITCGVKFPGKIPAPKPRFVRASSRYKHDIVNHHAVDLKRYTTFEKAGKVPMGKRVDGYNSHSPEYGIVNNKYPVNDEARVHREKQLALYEASVRYQATHDYDPLKGEFCNPNKEQQYLQERATIQKNHHIDSPNSRLRLKDKTDGELYNIVNNTVLDSDGLGKKIAYDNRSLVVRRKKNEFEVRVARQQHEKYKLECLQKLNRVSIRREDEISMRGFDAITNQPFSGVGAKRLPRSQKTRPLSTWEKAKSMSHRVRETKVKSARMGKGNNNLAESGRKIMQAATTNIKSAPRVKKTPAVPGLQLQSSNAVRTGGF